MSNLPPPNVIEVIDVSFLISALSVAFFLGSFKLGVVRWSMFTRDFPQDESQDDGDRTNDQRTYVEVFKEFHHSVQLLLNIGKVRAALAAEVGRLSTAFVRTLFPTQTFVNFSFEGQA